MQSFRKNLTKLGLALLIFAHVGVTAQERAKRRTSEGSLIAVLHICSDSSGKPYKVEVARSSGDRQKDKAAVAVARKWKFPRQQADGTVSPECADVPVEMKVS